VGRSAVLASQRFKATERALWHGALLRSLETGVAVYDTLFVELAEREGAPLVTFDQRLLKNWPAIACRPAEVGAR
jgi:predicted nucleic acid-binding protein